MRLSSGILTALQLPLSTVTRDPCASLATLPPIPGVRITSSVRYPAGSNITTGADTTCSMPYQENAVEICRVQGVITTSSTSSVKFDMWLPDVWYGRLLFTGNGGLGGCVDYSSLDHGSYLHFATIGTNNGRDGYSNADTFLMPHKVESIVDFSHRSVHAAAQVGKRIAAFYYRSEPHHSYFSGCSAGGRQGMSIASRYPDDFDGIIAGAPAFDWNNLLGAPTIWASHVAAKTSSYIPKDVWETVVAPEILKQCDWLDGRIDGIIANPDACQFDPTTLLCAQKTASDRFGCLIHAQVDGLKEFYKPIYGSDGDLLFARFDPGAEDDMLYGLGMSGAISPMTEIWYKYAVYGNPKHSLSDFSVKDLEYADALDPVGISTWDNALPGLAQFKRRGGKMLTYHGTRDPMIPSGQSKRFYKLLSTSLSHSLKGRTAEMDSFYRFFMIPGMGHCFGGPGAWKFGEGAGTGGANKTDHSLVLSIVDWVENGNPPVVIIGTDDRNVERKHCMWPRSETVWTGTEWICQSV